MATRHFKNRRPKPKPTQNENKRALPVLSSFELDQLPQRELHAYLHQTILSNLPYYTALARYRDFQTSENRTGNKSLMEGKKLHFRSRLTERGLYLLKTGYAKKPKSPV